MDINDGGLIYCNDSDINCEISDSITKNDINIIIRKELRQLLLDDPEFLQELLNEIRIQKINKLKK